MLWLGSWASFFDTRLRGGTLCRLWPGLLHGLRTLLRLRAHLLRTLRRSLLTCLWLDALLVWQLLRRDVVGLRTHLLWRWTLRFRGAVVDCGLTRTVRFRSAVIDCGLAGTLCFRGSVVDSGLAGTGGFRGASVVPLSGTTAEASTSWRRGDARRGGDRTCGDGLRRTAVVGGERLRSVV